jgi:hypothetical protein
MPDILLEEKYLDHPNSPTGHGGWSLGRLHRIVYVRTRQLLLFDSLAEQTGWMLDVAVSY